MPERLPNFVYIGPSKAGSTWLHEVLIRHPQVCMTEAKDLYFFDRYFDRGPEWYAERFRHARPEHRIVGEVCQEYLSCAEAPQRMSRLLPPDLKLMVTVRDPVARAFSGYLYMRKHGVFEETFREALETRPGLLDHARYATLLSRYLRYFDASAIHCAVFDDLVEEPRQFVEDLVDWLGLDPMVPDESLLAARLPAGQARSVPVARLVKQGANWARRHNATTLIGQVKRSTLVQRSLYRTLDDKPAIREEDAEFVRVRMRDEIARLEDMFGLELRRRWGWVG